MASTAELEYLRRQNARSRASRDQGVQAVEQSGGSIEPEQSGGDFWSQVGGFFDNLSEGFMRGILGAVEGVGDLVATGIGAIGDWTGLYDSKPFTDYAEKDLASAWAEHAKVYNVTGLANVGRVFDPTYWENFAQDTQNLLAATFGDADTPESLVGRQDYRYDDAIDNPLEEFLVDATESIGFMVPSIAAGGVAAAGKVGAAANTAAKAASLTSMGLSAAGKGSEEALNDGAGAGQALGYGAVSGAIEAATELIPWPGGNSFAGLTGGEIAKKGLLKNMVEEGLEEIISGALDPVKKSVYKGSDAFKDWLKPEFWLGTDGNFLQSVAGQGVSGSFVGGLMSGGSMASNLAKYGGVKEYNKVVEFQTALDANKQVLENYGKGKITYEVAQNQLDENNKILKSCGETMEEMAKANHKFKDALYGKPVTEAEYNKPEFQQKLSKMLEEGANPKSYEQYQSDFYSEAMREFRESFTADGMTRILEYVNDNWKETGKAREPVYLMPNDYFRYDVTDDAGNVVGYNYAKAFHANGGIYINQQYADKFAGLLGHEGIVHSILDLSPEVRDSLLEKAKKIDPEAFEKLAKKLQGLDYINGTDEYNSELIAHYLESQLSTLDGVMRLAKGKFNVVDALKSVFKFGKGIGYARLMANVANAIRAVESAKDYAKLKEKMAPARASASDSNQAEKQDKKNRYSKSYKLEDIRFSKQIDEAIASDPSVKKSKSNNNIGNPLSEGQAEFFKDSKVVDENGNLMVAYHGTLNPGFTVFDSGSHAGFLGTGSEKAKIHGGAEVNWFAGSTQTSNTYAYRKIAELADVDLDALLMDKLDKVFGKEKNAKEFIKALKEKAVWPKVMQLYNVETGEIVYEENLYSKQSIEIKHEVQEIIKTFKEIDGITCKAQVVDYNQNDISLKEVYANTNKFEQGFTEDDDFEASYSKDEKHPYKVYMLMFPTRGYFPSMERVYFRDLSLAKLSTVYRIGTEVFPSITDDVMNDKSLGRVAGGILPVYLNIKNPLIVDAKNASWNRFKFDGKTYSTRKLVDYALGKGYDGLIVKNIEDISTSDYLDDFGEELIPGDIFVTLKSKDQIKSVFNFNPTDNPDIRYSKSDAKYTEKEMNQVVEGFENTIDNLEEQLRDTVTTLALSRDEIRDVKRALKDQFAQEAKELKALTPLAQQLVMAHVNSRIHADGIVEIPSDAESISANAEKVMLTPFSQGNVIQKGRLHLKEFVLAVEQLADKYNGETFGGLYDKAIAMALNDIVENWDVEGYANSAQERRAIELYKAIRKLGGDDARRIEIDRIRDASEADYAFESLGLYKDSGKLVRSTQKLMSMVSDPRATIDMFFSELSPIGQKLITEASKQAGYARVYEFEAQQRIAEIQKELGLDKAVKPVEIGGRNMPYAAALEWRLMLKMDEGTKEFKNANRGYSFKDSKTDKEVVIEYSDEIQRQLEEAIPDELADKAYEMIVDGFYGKFIYDKIAEVYERATGLKYGDLMPRGEYMRLATRQLRESLQSPSVQGVPSMSNLMQRSKNPGPVKMKGGLFSKMFETARMTAYETYLQPLASDVDHIMNTLTKDGKSTLLKQFPDFKKQFLKWYTRALTGGIHPEATGAFGQAMVSMVLTNFKIGPIQTLSAFTSGLSPLEQFNPRLMKEAMLPSGKYEKALKNLLEFLPEAKNRGATNEVYRGNVGDVKDGKWSEYMSKIGEFATKVVGTGKFDRATVRYILLSALNTQAKAMGLPIDDIKVAQATEERARQLYMTQISSDSKFFSPAQYVDNPYGKTTGTQTMLMRMVKAYGGAAKAFTNFANRTFLRLFRMHNATKFASQHTVSEYNAEIRQAEKSIEATKNELTSAREALSEATDKRIEARDNRTKDKAKTRVWESAMEKVHRIEDQIEEVTADKEHLKENEKRLEKLNQDLKEARERAASFHSGFKPHEQAIYEKARDAERAAKKNVKRLEAKLRVEENKKATAEGHKAFYEKTKASVESWNKKSGYAKSVSTLVAGLLLAGLGKTAIDWIYALLLGRKDKDDLNAQEILPALALNSTANLYPGLRTIAGIFQGYEANDPTVQTINLMTDAVHSVQDFAGNQSEGNAKKMIRNGLQLAGLVFGIPFKTMYDQVTGVMSHFDPAMALQARNILYQVSSQQAGLYHSAIESGDKTNAKKHLQAIAAERVGEISSDEADEIVRLASAGEDYIPSAIPVTTTGDDGSATPIAWTKQQEAKKHYTRANSQVAKAIQSSEYKKMDDSAKMRLIKSIYSAYRSASLAKADVPATMSKSALLAKTNDPKVGQILTAVAYIRTLTATKAKTRKEQAVAYVNKLPLPKNDKLLILSMAGYSVDSKSVAAALRSKGMSNADIKSFQGEN